MSRQRLGLALVLLLTVAGLGLAATTVDRVESGDGGSGVGGLGEDSGVQSGDDQRLLAVIIVALAVAVLASTVYTLYRRAFPWEYVAVILVCAAIVLLLVLASQVLVNEGSAPEPTGQLDGTPDPPESAATPTGRLRPGAADAGDSSAPLTLGALFAVLLVGALAVVWFSTGHEPVSGPPDQKSDAQQAVAAAAGRAADELDESTLDNAVYRAWREMTDALDVADPETTTPAEFEDVAVDAGLDREDVRTLTGLFREVRYGGADATPEREQRARETMRRIEETYASGDDGGASP
jgi:hypothetical protein